MRIVDTYSHKGGAELLSRKHAKLLREVKAIIAAVDAEAAKTKISKEKTMPGRELYSPVALNTAFSSLLKDKKWEKKRIWPREKSGKKGREFREVDGIKNNVGIEVQFGKYAFLTYDVVAKMVIFKNLGLLQAGIEICPMRTLQDEMSTGIGSFEQLIWDLQTRGVANIDVPVLILGIDRERPAQERLTELEVQAPRKIIRQRRLP